MGCCSRAINKICKPGCMDPSMPVYLHGSRMARMASSCAWQLGADTFEGPVAVADITKPGLIDMES